MEFKSFDIKSIGSKTLLVGGVWADDDALHVFIFPEFQNEPGGGLDLHIYDLTTEEWQEALRQSDLMETEVLEKAEDGKLYKAIARKCQRNIDQGVSWNVFRRDGYRCRYCGNDKVPLTVDHLALWEEGGPSIEENLVAACRKCNKRRGNTQYADWLEHEHYLKVSKNLTTEIRLANEAIVKTLDAIPLFVGKRKKR